MVDDDVGDESHSLVLVGLDHRAELVLSTEGTILLEPIDGMVAHVHAHRSCISRIGYPHEIEIL